MIFLEPSRLHPSQNAARIVALILLPMLSAVIAEDAPVSLERISGLVDSDADTMNFRFRTKFNRRYVDDQNTRVPMDYLRVNIRIRFPKNQKG